MIRTVPQAAKWIDKAGLALLFPKPDVVLPSLWEQVSKSQVVDWNAPEINFFWRAKDELPGAVSPASASTSGGRSRASRRGSCRCSSRRTASRQTTIRSSRRFASSAR
ncbi:MAG: hypothetical protein H0X39_03040 [Actinobacteria bacterium]|nr:hypothetical protein [Actinomycetota bacterium]